MRNLWTRKTSDTIGEDPPQDRGTLLHPATYIRITVLPTRQDPGEPAETAEPSSGFPNYLFFS